MIKEKKRHSVKKILFLGSQIATGGAQRVLFDQANWFNEHGYQVSVAFLYDKSDELNNLQEQYNFSIIDLYFIRKEHNNIFLRSLDILFGIFRLYKLMIKEKFEVVETFTHHSNIIGLPLAWISGIKIRLGSHHGKILDFPELLDRIHTWISNSFMTTKLIAVSKAVQNDAISSGIKAEKTIMIPNGIQISKLDDIDKAYIKRELGFPEDTIILLTVGRLTFEKGHTFIVQAMPNIIRMVPQARLVLAGDGILRKELEDEVDLLKLREQVHFLGFRNDIPQLLASSDLFILPSRSEGLPMVILEAMSMMLPIVSSNVGGIGEVIKDRENGRLVNAGDVDFLSEVIIELIQDKETREKYAIQGRKIVESRYTVDVMCGTIRQLINMCIK